MGKLTASMFETGSQAAGTDPPVSWPSDPQF